MNAQKIQSKSQLSIQIAAVNNKRDIFIENVKFRDSEI